jgi:hypothetical protein
MNQLNKIALEETHEPVRERDGAHTGTALQQHLKPNKFNVISK